MDGSQLIARITHISRGSFHDGPGIRTVVYFKGCSLRCQWCHNPETLSPRPEILHVPAKCIHCGRCVDLCPEHHRIQGDALTLLREGCTGCGACAEACPSGALTLCGEEYTPDRLMGEIVKDLPYYRQSGGGVTLSGGECLLQGAFVARVAELCRREGIHCCIESALCVPASTVREVCPGVDMIFADMKLPDTHRHRRYTGQGNELILENLRWLSHHHDCVTLRIPLIPGVNDAPTDMDAFAARIGELGSGVRAVELLRYNYLAAGKYAVAGREYTDFGDRAQSDGEMAALADRLRRALPEDVALLYT